MREIWKDVVGYEGYYQVSNLSRVMRIAGYVKYRGDKRWCNGRILTPQDNGMGYYRVKLTVDNKPKAIMLHRIIAMAFIENPKNYPCVNHKDGNKKNNNISNLEWCTQKYNILHARATGLVDLEKLRKATSATGKKTVKNICGWNSRKVINKRNGVIYPSVVASAKDYGINRRYLHDVLSGKGKNETTLEFLKI